MSKQLTTALVGAIALGMGLAGSAEAVQISLGGDKYEITTEFGRFRDLQTTLEDQPWWRDEDLAKSAAQQVADQFGDIEFINGTNSGPFFAWRTFGENNFQFSFYSTESGEVGIGTRGQGSQETFAVATKIPEPASVLGLIGVGAVAAGSTLRKKATA